MAAWVASLAFVVLALVVRSLLLEYKSPLRQVPGPFAARFTNLWRFIDVVRGHTDRTQRGLHSKYGAAIRIGPRCVTVTDPKLVKVIYGWKPRWIKSDYYKTSDIRHGKSVFHSTVSYRDEAEHDVMNRPVAKFYSTTGALRYEKRFNRVIKLFLGRLDELYAMTGKLCPMDDWLTFCAWDAMGFSSFGKDFGCLREGRDTQGLLRNAEKALDYIASIGQIPFMDDYLDKNPIIQINPGSMSTAAAYAARQTQGRLEGTDMQDEADGPDFLEDFISLRKENPEITPARLIQYSSRNVAAGADTTAISLKTVVYYLSRHAKCQSALQAELDGNGITTTVKAGQVPAFGDIQRLPYLTAAIQEGFRVHPGVGLPLERLVPPPGFTLPDGRFLPAGTIIGINPAVIAKQSSIYGEDVDEYRPERWLRRVGESEDEYKGRLSQMKEADMTFGYGPRICAGRHVATVEIYKIIASLFAVFEVEAASREPWKTRNSFFHRQWGMDVLFRKR